MPALWGNLLSSAAQSYNTYNTQQQDENYQRQLQAQQLAASQLANQSATLQIQQQQAAITQDAAQTGFLTGAAQDVYGQQGGANGLASQAQQQGQTAGAPQAAGDALAVAQTSGVTQAATAAPNPSLPAPLRNNNPGALMGRDGQLQKFPTLAAGQQALDSNLQSYGNKGINTVQDIIGKWAPASAGNDTASYIKDVSQRLGVDPSQPLNMQDPQVRASLGRAIAVHENGRAAVASTAQNTTATQAQQQASAQQQAQAQQAQQLAQPSPADALTTKIDAGAQIRPDEYQQAAQGTLKQASMYKDAADKAFAKGNVKAGQAFTEKANSLTDQALKTQKEGFTVQKDANEETAKLAVGVHDQPSYANFQAQVRNNPAMQRAVAGLNLTWQYDEDRQKIATLADRTVTLKDQQELAIKKGELQLKQDQDQRTQQKVDQVKVAQQQAQVQDQKRTDANAKQGIPTVPSLAATMVGATPAQIQMQQSKIDKDRETYVKGLNQTIEGTRNVDAFSKEIIGLLNPKAPGGAVSTGGFWSANIPGAGSLITSMEPSRQQFAKAAQNLVNAQQATLSALGAGRSAGTAAMSKILSSAKPDVVSIGNKTNSEMAQHIYLANQLVKEQAQFQTEFMRANPSATSADSALEWQRFENTLGDMTYEDDTAETRVRFNDKVAQFNPDGSQNKGWVDWHNYFRNNP